MKDKELHLNASNASTKVQHLIEALSNAISQGVFKPGDALPSVNVISKQYNLSRDTVFKAYQELKLRGIVDSTPAKGYHVVGLLNKVLLILDVYSPFKDVLYNAFVSNLPKNYKVDLVFHFYNERVFESVIFDSIGRYTNYVVMNFSNELFHDAMKKIDASKLLLLDLGDFEKGDYSYVSQDFGKSVYSCLMEGMDRFRKYEKIIFYFPDDSEHPRVTIKYFKRFCKDNNFQYDVIQKIKKEEFRKGVAYFMIRQKELVEVVKLCREKEFKIGENIGLIAFNDTPMYEIIENGITVISTDFAMMGAKAAEFISTHQKIKEVIPTRLIMRGSL
jgi:hypothetical protein